MQIKSSLTLLLTLTSLTALIPPTLATPPRIDQTETCELLIAGGGLAGTAAAYEGLLAGRTVCLTDITDWLGGQISSQGTSALDERKTQKSLLFYPRGYLELRRRIKEKYGRLNPGACWVSESCFLPGDGHQILVKMLKDAEKKGKGKLKWFPATVIKDLNIDGKFIKSGIAIQHQPLPGTPALNTEPLSATITAAYSYENTPNFQKKIIQFIPASNPKNSQEPNPDGNPEWYVIDATETGELIGLADVPYRLGIDPRTAFDPGSSSATPNPYCTQGFTYTFAMEATPQPISHQLPSFYQQYEPYYSYEKKYLASFEKVFTYRRIWSKKPDEKRGGDPAKWPIYPGDIAMQNWTWGNDYRPGTATDNLIYSREQLLADNQLEPGGWMGGLRVDTLRKGEENAIAFFYWLVEGVTDSQLGNGVKKKYPNYRFLQGLNSPMGTVHGLSKYPYMREGRRIIGRPDLNNPDGFMVSEVDISRADFRRDIYQQNLSEQTYRHLWLNIAGLQAPSLAVGSRTLEEVKPRSRSTIYPDSIGIGHYAIDFHPCMQETPPEKPGNKEQPGERFAGGTAYPFQIPLRATIPQKIDNMLVAGKSIATSHIAAAAYRVHSFEWSVGAGVGTTADFSLKYGIMPYQMTDNLPASNRVIESLQKQLQRNGNPTAFPGTSIFNTDWKAWD